MVVVRRNSFEGEKADYGDKGGWGALVLISDEVPRLESPPKKVVDVHLVTAGVDSISLITIVNMRGGVIAKELKASKFS